MTIKLYNTLTKSKEELPPKESPLTVYTCGPTVYLDPQIGNWRMFIFYDTLMRSLNVLGYKTKHVINVTDVGHLVSDQDEGEDKLARQAEKEKKTAWDIAAFYTERYMAGRNKLNMLPPDHMPKATDTIKEQIELIQAIESKDATYRIDDGIYFDISKFPDYGKMAQLDLAHQETSTRIEENTQKRNPQDFALWKFSPEGIKRDMEWDSPWGRGFPGWHIECSAMAKKFLGETIDIHAGGIDHIPVHHTNEIAQSETANGAHYARFWLHGGFMLVNGTKLSKSLGNSHTIEDIEKRGISPLAFRLMVLQSHYRSESNFTWEGLEAAQERINSLYSFAELRWQTQMSLEEQSTDLDATFQEKVKSAIADDMNTPKVLELLSEYMKSSHLGISPNRQETYTASLKLLDDILGLDIIDQTPDITDKAKSIIQKRIDAKNSKDFTLSDSLRTELETHGITLDDFNAYSLWHKIRK